MEDTLNFLSRTALFESLTRQEIGLIAADILPRRFKMGEIIFREGEDGGVLYFVRKGKFESLSIV